MISEVMLETTTREDLAFSGESMYEYEVFLETDVNCDGIRDEYDYKIICDNLGQTTTNTEWNSYWLLGDLNHDGVVDKKDVEIIEKYYMPDPTLIVENK